MDPEVIKERSKISSQSTTRHPEFHDSVLERDGCCVFSGHDAFRCHAIHIIPHARGSEVCFVFLPWHKYDVIFQWLQLIIQNRPHYDENMEDSTDIDDVRNGVLADAGMHHPFNLREEVILKVCHPIAFPLDCFSISCLYANIQTPNFVLDPADIPQRAMRVVPAGSAYPDHERYTLQQLYPPISMVNYPNNLDAAFLNNT